MENREEEKFKLPGGKVKVRLVNRARGAVKDPNHLLYNLAQGATIEFCPRNKKGTNIIDCPLTPEEIEFFEDKRKSGMSFEIGELSPFADDKVNFWRSKRSRVALDNREKIFDLSKAIDYLQYKILLSNSDKVAASLEEEFNSKEYIYVMTSEESEQKKALTRGDEKKRAWKIAAKMENDRDKMIDFLSVVGKRPSANSKTDFLVAEVDKFLEGNIKEFLTILEDPQYETRVLLTKALQIKAIIKDGNKYFSADGEALCKKGEVNNLKNALNYLDAPENQDIRLVIEGKLSRQ